MRAWCLEPTLGRERIVRALMRVLGLMLVAPVLIGCGLLPIVEPAAPIEGMPAKAGPTIELGRGTTLGVDWRYAVYPSDIGWCTQIDHGPGGGGGSACGGQLIPAGPLTLTGAGSGTDMPNYVEGIASDDVAAVWAETADGERAPAILMSLAPAGFEGQVVIAWLSPDDDWESVVALGADGTELGRESIAPFLP